MRTLNVKVAVIFGMMVIAIAGSTHLLHSFQLSRHSTSFKTMAHAAWDDNPRRYSDAISCMRAYLALQPKDYAAVKDLGFWMAESGQYGPAAQMLEELVRALSNQNATDNKQTILEIRQKLVQLAMRTGRCSDAVAHLKFLLQDFPVDHPEQLDAVGASLLKILGNCYVALSKDDEAIDCFKKALANPKNRGRVDIYYDLAMTYRFHMQSLPDARQCMADMIAVDENNKSPDAHHTYGLWLAELGDYKEALLQAEATLKLAENHKGGLYLAGECEMNMQNFDKAENYVKKGLKIAPDEVAMYILLADIYVRSNHRDKAIEVFKTGFNAASSIDAKSQILWHQANLDLDGRNGVVDATSIRDAEDCIKQLRDFRYSPSKLDFLEARKLYANDDWKSAREQFENVRAAIAEFPQLTKCLDYWIGYCYLQQGNPDQADHAFHRALSVDKFYFKAHDGLAQIYFSSGRIKDAVSEYKQAIAGNPEDGEAWSAYARALVMATMRAKESDRNWEDVFHTLGQAQKHNPKDGHIELLAAEVLLAVNRDKDAEKILTSLHNDAQNVEYYLGKANFQARRGDIPAARKTLDEGRAKLGDHFLLRLGYATLSLRELNLRAGPDIQRQAEDLDGYSISEKTKLLNGLLNDFVDIREFDRAKAVCHQIARLQPHDAMVRYRLLELALLTNNRRDPKGTLAELDRILDEIENIAGQGPLWNYGKAVRLRLEASQTNKMELLDQALHFAGEAQKLRVDWSRPHVLEGEICRLRDENDEALQHYLQASILGDHDLDFVRLLLQMLFERQRYREAEEVIRRLDNNQVSVSKDVDFLEARIFAVWGEFDRALECARRYNPDSDDYTDHLWHGQILKILYRRAQLEGHQEKLPEILADAETSLRRAIEIAPNAVECWVELVQLLVTANEIEKARSVAVRFEESNASEAAPLASGYIYDALGDPKKAAQSYERAIKLRPDLPLAVRTLAEFYIRNHDWQHAAPLIDKLLDGQLVTSEVDLVSARRMKAALLASEGYPKYKQALDLIEQNIASPLVSPQDHRFKARICMADPRTALSNETLDIMKTLVEKGNVEPEPQDRYELARLYLRRDDWIACREQMEKLVNAGKCDPGYLAAFVKLLLDHDQLDDASLWLKRFEDISKPGAAVGLRADLIFRRNDWGEVTPYLNAYLDQEKSLPADRNSRLLIVAQLYEDFGSRLTAPAGRAAAAGYFAEAEKLLQGYAKTGPDGQMMLAGFYARRGRTQAAIELLEQYADKAAPARVAATAVTVVSSESVKPQQLSQVEKLLTAVAAAQNQPVPLLTALGVLNIVQGQPAKAEGFYRQVVAKNPKSVTAYNNLGELLAISGNSPIEALDLINHAIELAGPLPRLLDSRAVVRICRKEPQQALEDLETIMADKAEKIDPSWLFHKAWALKMSDRDEDARDVIHIGRNQYGLDRSKIDPPERDAYDQLIKDLNHK